MGPTGNTSKVNIDFRIIGNKQILIMIGMIGENRFYRQIDVLLLINLTLDMCF